MLLILSPAGINPGTEVTVFLPDRYHPSYNPIVRESATMRGNNIFFSELLYFIHPFFKINIDYFDASAGQQIKAVSIVVHIAIDDSFDS